MDPNRADRAHCFHLPQACSFYHRDKRGCSDTETLVLSLVLANYEEGYAVGIWANDSLVDVTSYTDGAYWPMPAAWKLKENRSYIVNSFDTYLDAISTDVLAKIGVAVSLYDGPGRTDAPIPPADIVMYLRNLRASSNDKAMLLGPGPKTGNESYGRGAPRRLVYLLPRVARKLLGDFNRHALRGLLRDGRAAASATPSYPELKQTYDETLLDLGAKRKQVVDLIDTNKKAKARAQVVRTNLATSLDRGRAKAKVQADAKNGDELESVRAQLREAKIGMSVARAFKKSKAGKFEWYTLKRKDNQLAALRAEVKAKDLKIMKLEKELETQSAGHEKLNGFFSGIWMPKQARGKGAGRGYAHGSIVRELCYKMLSLSVSPNAIPEVLSSVSSRPSGRSTVWRRKWTSPSHGRYGVFGRSSEP